MKTTLALVALSIAAVAVLSAMLFNVPVAGSVLFALGLGSILVGDYGQNTFSAALVMSDLSRVSLNRTERFGLAA